MFLIYPFLTEAFLILNESATFVFSGSTSLPSYNILDII